MAQHVRLNFAQFNIDFVSLKLSVWAEKLSFFQKWELNFFGYWSGFDLGRSLCQLILSAKPSNKIVNLL